MRAGMLAVTMGLPFTPVEASPWQWQPRPDVWLLVLALLGGYHYALARWGPHEVSGRRPVTRSQRWCYTLGVAAL